MFGLLARLSEIDSRAEAAVRVIAAFDALVEGRVSASTLTRATAALAECTAGMHLLDGTALRVAHSGTVDSSDRDVPRSRIDVGNGRAVWLEREGDAEALDDLILERFALATRVLVTPPRVISAANLADPALTELLISESAGTEERARAIQLLGLLPNLPIRIVAVSTSDDRDPGTEAVALVARTRFPVQSLRVATVGRTAGLILQPRQNADLVVPDLHSSVRDRLQERDPGSGRSLDLRVGIGNQVLPQDARTSWLQALLALRFTVHGENSAVVDHASLGSLTLLADVPIGQIAANVDVVALQAISETESGKLDLRALDALCRTGSLRLAANSLHMHHSSIAARVTRAEERLGWDLGTPDGILRARIALQSLHFLNSGES
ncbi:LysR family transcriptional regulator [Rhodococcus sp. ACS1]|uniref:helix-turn-helix domain-containing protein n=1 Tax=Rhodococcus sp. ACS1 TaxID=2028570 RepID=UPI000BB0F18F|nr:helix-turn-helix domain-containing protein [Rhodococcus sp. ACS1]PBC48046.1 LysR family transcriptional regulator [Rhodococcus sp. ACS1]